MSKSKDLENILDICLDRLMFNGETIDECLNDYPEFAHDLKPLLEAATVTSKVSELEPSKEFRERSRIQMYAELQEVEVKKSRSFFRFRLQPRLVTAIAVVLALFMATGGTAAAASNAMPDDFLYPVKRATEEVQLAFTFTTLGKAEFHARMADRRVEEIVYMAEKNDTEEIELLAASLNKNLTKIASHTSALNAADVSGEGMTVQGQTAIATEDANYDEWDETEEPLLAARAPESEEEILTEEAEPGVTVTADISAFEEADVDTETSESVALVPAPAAEKVTASEATSGQKKQQGNMVGTSENGNTSRRARLNVTIINQANKNITILKNLLDEVPDSVKPTIQIAIDISEEGYEKAIESLQ